MSIQCSLFTWGTPIETERHKRIRLTLWAYAYEMQSVSIVSDGVFDAVARSSQPLIETGRLDQWWRENFTPDTGMWIRSHPEMHLVERMYHRYAEAASSMDRSSPVRASTAG